MFFQEFLSPLITHHTYLLFSSSFCAYSKQTKFATKAFKLQKKDITTLCDFFDVDRSGEDGKQLTKEDLIDRLLDFLGAPDEDLTKASSKKSTKKTLAPAKKKTKKKTNSRSKGKKEKKEEEENDDEEEEEEEEEKQENGEPPDYSVVIEAKKGEMPSDVALQQWVRAYIACFDMDSATTTHAITTASAKFGVDVSSKKNRIKEILAEEM
jgi:hypothetical protein